MKQHRAGMEETLSSAKSQLDKLGREVTTAMKKIQSREKFLNTQLEALLNQYRATQVDIKFNEVC